MSKKNNNTGAKWIVAIFVAVFICSILITELMASSDNELNEIDITKYTSELSLEDEKLVLLTKDDCSECDNMALALEEIKLLEGVKVLTINVDNLSASDKEQLLESSDLINLDVLPTVLHISVGKVIGTYTDDAKSDDIMSFVNIFNKTTVDEYVELKEKDGEYIVYIGRPTCGYCVQSEPWLKRISHDLGKNVYYINTDEQSAPDLITLTEETDEIYRGATPLFLIIKDGLIVDYQEGAGSYNSLKEFFDGENKE